MLDISRDIVAQAIKGERRAYEEIYKACSGFVYSVAYRISNNKSDAEEVTQDVFVSIYRNLKNFEFKSSFKTWVYRITVNSAINKYRQSSRENERRHQYGQEVDIGQYSNNVSQFLDKESAEKLVASMLGVLTAEQRTCILLREIEGLSYQEMSEVLKININTVRSRLRRARQEILDKFNKGVESYELRKD